MSYGIALELIRNSVNTFLVTDNTNYANDSQGDNVVIEVIKIKKYPTKLKDSYNVYNMDIQGLLMITASTQHSFNNFIDKLFYKEGTIYGKGKASYTNVSILFDIRNIKLSTKRISDSKIATSKSTELLMGEIKFNAMFQDLEIQKDINYPTINEVTL